MVQQFVALMDGMPPLPLVCLYAALAGPFVAAIHECGHACAALWRTSKPVVIAIAVRGFSLDRRIGRLQFTAQRISGQGGLCAYDQTGLSSLEVALIAIAGPVASVLGAAATLVLALHTGGVLHDLLWIATLSGALAAVVSALPLNYRAGKGDDTVIVRLDGLQALDALRRASRPSAPRPQPRDVKAGPVAERWAAEVDAGSIPPPGC